jgi:hypothetical protein
LTYNGVTVLHYLLGAAGIAIGYGSSTLSAFFGGLYLLYALVQMYLLMPLMVCPNCVYYGMENAVCISAMNLVSRKIARPGRLIDFDKRAKGLFCHNNLYMASFILPIVALIPALVMHFSSAVLGILLGLVGLMTFRIFVLFPRIACNHCSARNLCPNARAMGISGT